MRRAAAVFSSHPIAAAHPTFLTLVKMASCDGNLLKTETLMGGAIHPTASELFSIVTFRRPRMSRIMSLKWILMREIWWTFRSAPEEMATTPTPIGRLMADEWFSYG